MINSSSFSLANRGHKRSLGRRDVVDNIGQIFALTNSGMCVINSHDSPQINRSNTLAASATLPDDLARALSFFSSSAFVSLDCATPGLIAFGA